MYLLTLFGNIKSEHGRSFQTENRPFFIVWLEKNLSDLIQCSISSIITFLITNRSGEKRFGRMIKSLINRCTQY